MQEKKKMISGIFITNIYVFITDNKSSDHKKSFNFPLKFTMFTNIKY